MNLNTKLQHVVSEGTDISHKSQWILDVYLKKEIKISFFLLSFL